MNKTKVFQKCFIGILFIVAGGIYLGTSITRTFCSDQDESEIVVNKTDDDFTELPELEANSVIVTVVPKEDKDTRQYETKDTVVTSSIIEEKKRIIVHVCGCVRKPDVYELQEDARLIDAVTKAQGFTKDAACDSVNQAQLLKDGQKIYIPSKEEIKEGFQLEESEFAEGNSKENHLIDLNLATKDELMTLPGIGETKADRILGYRKEHGGFQTIEDIMQIAGVKEAIFSKVKDYITVK